MRRKRRVVLKTNLKPAVVIWSPFTIEPLITGSKVNEVERIKTLSKRFTIFVFVLINVGNMRMIDTYKRYWFEGIDAKIVALPWLDNYGVRIISRLAAATVAAMSVVLLHLNRRVDLIIARDGVSSLPLVLASRLMSIRLLYNVLSVPFGHREARLLGGFLMQNRLSLFLFKSIEYFTLRRADYVGVMGEVTAKKLTAIFGNMFQSKIVIIPYPIPDEFYCLAEPSALKGSIQLIYTGGRTGLYDFSGLVKALEELHAAGMDVRLVVYSSREARQTLNDLTSVKTLLVFRDQLPRTHLARIIHETTAMVVPLSAESPGTSVKAIEAMALGVPVIVSYPKDPKLFRDGETCVVVSNNTTCEWRQAIMRITVPELRDKILRGARVEAEAFRSGRNLDVVSALIMSRARNH